MDEETVIDKLIKSWEKKYGIELDKNGIRIIKSVIEFELKGSFQVGLDSDFDKPEYSYRDAMDQKWYGNQIKKMKRNLQEMRKYGPVFLD